MVVELQRTTGTAFSMDLHRAGKKHGNADALSRKPVPVDTCGSYTLGVAVDNLTCGGCKYCVRADDQRGIFSRDVNYAVGMTSQRPETRDGRSIIDQARNSVRQEETAASFNGAQRPHSEIAGIRRWTA